MGTTLRALGPSDEVTDADLEVLDVGRALAKRAAIGGTAPVRVARAARAARRALDAARRRA